jgi:hypothetical protein
VLEIFLLAVGVPCIIVLIAAENAIVTHRDDLRGTHCSYQLSFATLLCCYSYRVCRCGRGSLLNGMIRVARPKTIQRPGGTILHSNTTT